MVRLHECCGPARHGFALWLAAQIGGAVLWVAPRGRTEHLNPDGMSALADPGQAVFVETKRDDDALWVLEEALRSGALGLVVGDLPGPPGLRAVRRLHLAAQEGASHGIHQPLGLILTPGDGGAPGIETRWHMTQAHTSRAARWQLERRRARSLPPKTWILGPGSQGLAPAA